MSAEGIFEELKDLTVKIVVKEAVARLVTQAPWLSTGPVNWIVVQLLTWVTRFLVTKTILGANLLLIEVYIDGRVGDFEDILDKINKAVTDEERERLEDELVEVSRKLIRFRDHIRLPDGPA
jgi:hypothetical protein